MDDSKCFKIILIIPKLILNSPLIFGRYTLLYSYLTFCSIVYIHTLLTSLYIAFISIRFHKRYTAWIDTLSAISYIIIIQLGRDVGEGHVPEGIGREGWRGVHQLYVR